jgi:hypothetical protein
MSQELVTANINGQLRKEVLNGREYTVANMTMIVPGVLNGNQGALYYSPEEVARNSDAWNGMPIVVYHPSDSSGKSLSARQPAVLDKAGVGTVFNSRINDNGNLIAEAWFDSKQTDKVDNRVTAALNAGQVLELSTGLFLDTKLAENGATHEGNSYKYIATNYRPDHLAVLPDQTGACSIVDGCGVLNKGDDDNDPPFVDKILNAINEFAGKGVTMAKKEVIDGLITNCDCWTEDDRETLNAMSDEQLARHEKTVSDFVANQKKTEELTTEVATLVANAKFVKKSDDEEEEEEEGKEKKKAVAKNEENKSMTDQEWLDAAPEGIRSVVANSMAWEDQERARLIDTIIAGKDDKVKEVLTNRLKDRSLGELNDFVLLAPEAPKETPKPVANYVGAAAPALHVQSAEETHEPMPQAVWNWDEN